MKRFLGVSLLILPLVVNAKTTVVLDSSRERSIPVEIEFPKNTDNCTPLNRCNVAFISAGNRVPFTKYKFVSETLNRLGYMTVAVDHELSTDPPLSRTGDLYQTRIENWERGADTLDFLQRELGMRFPSFDFNKLTLVGHSNGGDISTWLSNEHKKYIYQLITLDHMRVTLPKTDKMKVLSVRASEYPTKSGVLPTEAEQQTYGSCIVEIPASKHMDLTDYGLSAVQQKTINIISGFVKGLTCADLRTEV
ncbi:alpha/beta hydrolase [Photobacterium sp. 53610]|uniref:alpha/beta hydrolase n=1 Tax=Photobacterium sp. 53610 TaxID=3102789 RepID=UPI002ED9C983